ncbi:MAG: type II toxin-antitoxin system RelE/ParE family toxin [Magnetococcales bacterium]|nr:type II toxin-antitoxin system RelE/ParE family toxin [Magnetococcales bacterium]
MAWVVEIRAGAARQIEHLDRRDQTRILRFLRERLNGCFDPRLSGQALKGELTGLWRYRIGDYRLLCQLRDEVVTVIVMEVGHRREIYR